MARCHSNMVVTLTAMRCTRRNWCSWSAVAIQMRVSMKLRLVCTKSAPRDGDLRIGCFITSRASRDPFEPEMSVIAFVSQYGFPSRNGGPIRIQVGVGAGLRRFATPPYFFLVALLVLLSPSDGPSK